MLNATLRHHLDKYESSHPVFTKKLERSLYVDDLVCPRGAGISDIRDSQRDFGFNLRKFHSNSTTLWAQVSSEAASESVSGETPAAADMEESYTASTLGIGQKLCSEEQKVLGIHWDTTSDRLLSNLEEIASTARDLIPTKRSIVSLVGRFYDPTGYLAPVVVQFKIFLRELCQTKIDWDERLPSELVEEWSTLSENLQYSQPLSVPRCYFEGVSDEEVRCTLCGFCDASPKAYAGVVYILLETSSGHSIKFVASKTRVAPIQHQTIPRLELLSTATLYDSLWFFCLFSASSPENTFLQN